MWSALVVRCALLLSLVAVSTASDPPTWLTLHKNMLAVLKTSYSTGVAPKSHKSLGSSLSSTWQSASLDTIDSSIVDFNATTSGSSTFVTWEPFPNISLSLTWPNVSSSRVLEFSALLHHDSSTVIDNALASTVSFVLEDYTPGQRRTLTQGQPSIKWSGLTFPPVAAALPKFYYEASGFQTGSTTSFSKEQGWLMAELTSPTEMLVATVVQVECHSSCKTCQDSGELGCVRCFPGNGFSSGRCSPCVVGSTYSSDPGDFESCHPVTSCPLLVTVRCWS